MKKEKRRWKVVWCVIEKVSVFIIIGENFSRIYKKTLTAVYWWQISVSSSQSCSLKQTLTWTFLVHVFCWATQFMSGHTGFWLELSLLYRKHMDNISAASVHWNLTSAFSQQERRRRRSTKVGQKSLFTFISCREVSVKYFKVKSFLQILHLYKWHKPEILIKWFVSMYD